MKLTPPAHDCTEIFLHPGEYYFGDQHTRLRTILGSCVAVTMWHPILRIGGMCHFLLPTRGAVTIPVLEGRYGDEALLMFLKEAVARETNPAVYTVKLFGGGNMFQQPGLAMTTDIGGRNVARAEELLQAFGFPIAARHVRDVGHRNIVFDLWSGHVWVKHVRPPCIPPSV